MVMPIMVVLLPIHIRYLSLSLLRGKKKRWGLGYCCLGKEYIWSLWKINVRIRWGMGALMIVVLGVYICI